MKIFTLLLKLVKNELLVVTFKIEKTEFLIFKASLLDYECGNVLILPIRIFCND